MGGFKLDFLLGKPREKDTSPGAAGTVTSVSIVTANGVSGSVANPTITPAITITLGAITPTSVNGITFSGSGSIANSGTSSLTGFTGSGSSSGTNTGDQTNITGNAGTVTVANEATDTTCFIGFFTDASGSLSPKTNTNMTFNSNTGVVTFASSVLTTADINGGTIDGTSIGASSPSTIIGTTIQANTSFLPDADGGTALGSATLGFSILGLASTSTINFANGNVLLTHSSAVLTVTTGDLRMGTAGTNSASVVTVGGSQSLTGKTYNGLTITTTTGTLTMTNGKTLSVTHSLTLAGTDGTTMTFPTTSKTIAANDGTNRALASQAAGDILVASSASAYTRLPIGTSGYVLRSNGTTAARDTDYALTFNYSFTTSVSTGDITITLLNYLGTTPSSTTPVRIWVKNTLVTYTSATTLTINNDSFYHFDAGSSELATYEVDYFIYAASSGGLCVSRLPWYTNFAQQGANQQDFLANGGGFSTQDLQNIGRYNATKASGSTGNWSIPATSIIINNPIFYTRNLNFTPTLQGSGGSIGTMTASPYTGTYTVRDNTVFYRVNIQCTNVGSWSGNVEVKLPFISKSEMGDNPVTGFVCPSGANPATASRAVPYITAGTALQRHLSGVDTANLSWGTFVVNDRIRAEGFYNVL